MGIIVGFALCFQRIKDKNLTLDSHLFSPLFLRRTHVVIGIEDAAAALHEKAVDGTIEKVVSGDPK